MYASTRVFLWKLYGSRARKLPLITRCVYLAGVNTAGFHHIIRPYLFLKLNPSRYCWQKWFHLPFTTNSRIRGWMEKLVLILVHSLGSRVNFLFYKRKHFRVQTCAKTSANMKVLFNAKLCNTARYFITGNQEKITRE